MTNFLDRFDKKKLFKGSLKIVLITTTVLGAGFILLRLMPSKQQKIQEKQVTEEIVIKPAIEAVSEEQMWRQSLQEKLDSESKKLNENITDLAQNVEGNQKEDIQERNAIKELEDKVAHLTGTITALSEAQRAVPQLEQKVALAKNISQYSLPLENSIAASDYKPVKTTDNYIPAGSFAKAVLLSGVDASTSLSSQNDPDPVLIRIVDHGTLPRRFKSDLKDCHVIGSSYGDLSSERAKIRLEKLACTEVSTGEIIETEIAGFVTGEDGRQGLRGSVVSTEGKLLGNSLLSGVLSGLSNNFTSRDTSVSLLPSGKTASTQDRLKGSMFEGASTSLDRLSKYYIDRAESLQPIVQVGAGRKIDVVFTEGVYFGTSTVKKEIAKKRDSQLKEAQQKTT